MTNTTTTTTTSRHGQLLKNAEDAIIQEKIQVEDIRRIAFEGLPEKPGLRATYWKLLFDYLPLERTKWTPTLAEKRKLYYGFIDDLIIDPRKLRESGGSGEARRASVKEESGGGMDPRRNSVRELVTGDDPLSQSKDSKWKTWFDDRLILQEIDKDVRRTLAHMHFFSHVANIHNLHQRVHRSVAQRGDGSEAIENVLIEDNTMDEEYDTIVGIKRILFIYAKLNPGILYVQGMNEILAPILYVISNDPLILDPREAEADAFFCFTALMSEIRDNFMKTMDGTDMGINGRIGDMNRLLRRCRPDLWSILNDVSLHPQFYSLRWLTLLFSQEFQLPDVLRLWDSLFADSIRFDFLLYVGCAMISLNEKVIRERDFSEILKKLQDTHGGGMDLMLVLNEALRLRAADSKSAQTASGSSPSPFSALGGSLLDRFTTSSTLSLGSSTSSMGSNPSNNNTNNTNNTVSNPSNSNNNSNGNNNVNINNNINNNNNNNNNNSSSSHNSNNSNNNNPNNNNSNLNNNNTTDNNNAARSASFSFGSFASKFNFTDFANQMKNILD